MHLYLDYQDGRWPEVHTAPFSSGTHEWEEKSIRVEPTRPVKTAMVLLEFHQPQGAAWFDDVTLFSGAGSEHNLLAAPGFEEEDVAAIQAEAISAGYEEQVRALLKSLEAAVSRLPRHRRSRPSGAGRRPGRLGEGQGAGTLLPPRASRPERMAGRRWGCARLLAAPR